MSFFKSMVVMGSGLALSCGGISGQETGSDVTDAGSGGTAAAGAGSGGSATAGTGTSGAPGGGVGNAGASGIGAAAGASSGASGAAGQPSVDPGPFACPPEQWDCSAQVVSCDYALDGWQLPDGCACDPARPLSPEDCGPEEVFVCRDGLLNSLGQPLAQAVPFECSCQPPSDSGWGCGTCTVYGVDLGCTREPADDPISVVCRCALPILR